MISMEFAWAAWNFHDLLFHILSGKLKIVMKFNISFVLHCLLILLCLNKDYVKKCLLIKGTLAVVMGITVYRCL